MRIPLANPLAGVSRTSNGKYSIVTVVFDRHDRRLPTGPSGLESQTGVFPRQPRSKLIFKRIPRKFDRPDFADLRPDHAM
jgi:hypothetical protein